VVNKCNLCGAKEFKKIISDNGYLVVECLNCGLVYLRNPPSKKEMKNLYSFENGYRKNAAKKKRDIERAMAQLKFINKHGQKGELLDVGCSVGLLLDFAKKDGWDVRGLDISKDALKVARDDFGLDVKEGVIAENSYPKEEFDVIHLGDYIEHVPDPKKTIGILKSFLKKNGVLVLTTPNSGGLSPRVSKNFSQLFGIWTHADPPAHLFQFSKKTIKNLLSGHGFQKITFFRTPFKIEGPVANFRARSLHKSVGGFFYTVLFMPLSIIGFLINQGSSMAVVAGRK